jgi:hypothetical protein
LKELIPSLLRVERLKVKGFGTVTKNLPLPAHGGTDGNSAAPETS